MKIVLKLKRYRPETLILHFADRQPVQLDYLKTSSIEIIKIIRSVAWVELEAYVGESMIWKVNRDEVEDLNDVGDPDADDNPSQFPKMPTLPDIDSMRDEPFVSPERWLSLMIHAQQSASMGERETIKLLLETMRENNDRGQDLLTQAHNMIVSQQEQIEGLVERVHADPPEKEDTDWEGRIERIVEGLAPIVAPLLMRATQGQQQQPVAQPPPVHALPPARPGRKASRKWLNNAQK